MRATITLAALLAASTCRVPCPEGAPPQIVGPVAVIEDGSMLTVKWYTDRPATTVLEYGATTAYGATYSATDLVTEHIAVPSGLVPGSTYHFRVRSEDKCGFEVASEDDTFEVAGGTGSGGGGDEGGGGGEGGGGETSAPLDPPILVANPTAACRVAHALIGSSPGKQHREASFTGASSIDQTRWRSGRLAACPPVEGSRRDGDLGCNKPISLEPISIP